MVEAFNKKHLRSLIREELLNLENSFDPELVLDLPTSLDFSA